MFLCVEFYLSQQMAISVQFFKLDELQLLCLQQLHSSGHSPVVINFHVIMESTSKIQAQIMY
jgi:hypothetical protein